MLDDFIIRAFVAGIGIAAVAGVLGCFVIWRRMAYFGDSLAHSALLGIVLGLVYKFSINIGIIIVCSMFAIVLVWLSNKKILSTDTLLGILAHASLSIGLIALALVDYPSIDLHRYLFGDILTVTWQDIYWIYIGAAIIILLLIKNFNALIVMVIHEDLAKAEGVNTFLQQLLLMFLMTIVVSFSVQVVGILLITSLLIIPAASSRQISSSPKKMAAFSALIASISVLFGLLLSINFDLPTGPAIVVVSAVIFTLILTLDYIKSLILKTS